MHGHVEVPLVARIVPENKLRGENRVKSNQMELL